MRRTQKIMRTPKITTPKITRTRKRLCESPAQLIDEKELGRWELILL
jgi:hypothetical protein